MSGVYERALGSDTDELHPKVSSRYALDADDETVCVGRGVMHISRGTHVLPALYAMTSRNLLFPEAGKHVPFSVKTMAFRTTTGYDALTTRREFEFSRRRRRFDSVTVWDHEADRLLDFLGTGGLLVSELVPHVDGGALVVESGRQWVRYDGEYRRLPGPLGASVDVRDEFDDTTEQYRVHATVENTLAGHILSYRGSFTQEMHDIGDIDDIGEDGLEPTRELTLPPRS